MPDLAAPSRVRFEHHPDGFGIGTPAPRLSWIVTGAPPGYAQAAYEVEWTPDGGEPEVARVDSGEQVLVSWPFAPLTSRQRSEVRIRVNGGGEWSPWSEPMTVEAGLLSPDDWSASFISPSENAAFGDPAPVLQATFQAKGQIARARVYATALGVYTLSINGQRVGDHIFAPGWTSYHHRLRYQTYDVTDLIASGENVIESVLGNGWYRGNLGWQDQHSVYGDDLALMMQLEITYAGGTTQRVVTDESWRAGSTGILQDDFYNGQTTDLTVAKPEPSTPVRIVEQDRSILVAPDGPPIRITETVPAKEVFRSPSGKLLVDFGQNLVGWVRLTARNTTHGQRVVIRHAEVLEHGELGTRPLRSAKATDEFILPAADEITLEPDLTFHGFRYAEITGLDDVAPEDITALVIHSDMERTGWFECSDPLLNQLHENVVWGMRGNFVDVPTDCPQRDERMGWTGDIEVFAPTATFLYDSAGFLTSWLADLAAEQKPNGAVPYVIPDVLHHEDPTTAAWGDAATIVPWVLYQRYGDAGILRRQLPSMIAWVDRQADLAGDDLLWTGSFQFGDWLDPTAPPDEPGKSQVDPDLVATAYFAYSAQIVADAAAVLGETDVEEKYHTLAASVRQAIRDAWVTADGRVHSDAQTGYAMMIAFDLLETDEQRQRAGERLAELVREADHHIATGFVGTPIIMDALCATGQEETAWRLFLQQGCPSWLYPVTMGATTIWERWDSMLPDGSINPGSMTSFNHYALGAVADWMHRSLAGLAPAAPGYREIVVQPVLSEAVSSASARHLTPYGEASVSWTRENGTFTLRLTVPVGATASVNLPGASEPERVAHGAHEWTVPLP